MGKIDAMTTGSCGVPTQPVKLREKPSSLHVCLTLQSHSFHHIVLHLRMEMMPLPGNGDYQILPCKSQILDLKALNGTARHMQPLQDTPTTPCLPSRTSLPMPLTAPFPTQKESAPVRRNQKKGHGPSGLPQKARSMTIIAILCLSLEEALIF